MVSLASNASDYLSLFFSPIGVSGNSHSRSRKCLFLYSLPVPQFWEWIFSFPSCSRTLGMSKSHIAVLLNSMSVSDSHPTCGRQCNVWPQRRKWNENYLCCYGVGAKIRAILIFLHLNFRGGVKKTDVLRRFPPPPSGSAFCDFFLGAPPGAR